MKNTSEVTRRLSKKAGLTLIELLVVLVILIATGSLLVPTIKDALTRSHVATCASSFPEVHQMMQRVQLEFGAFGTDFDSGVDTADTTTPVNAAASAAPVIQTEALTADEVTALAAVGITSVVDHDATADDYNITFNIGATSRTLADGEPVITLTDAQAEAVFLPVGAGIKYVWFGIGRDWTLLGDLAPEPPVHFGDTAGVLPDDVHSRFGIIMQVGEDQDVDPGPDTILGTADDIITPIALERAEFKRVSYCIDGEGFETGDNHIEVYWEEVNQG